MEIYYAVHVLKKKRKMNASLDKRKMDAVLLTGFASIFTYKPF
ncbi:hypothetical protein [Oceanobacillus senegalensis]|nr:hypothetical protein [Oceanobacillus senegalensis]